MFKKPKDCPIGKDKPYYITKLTLSYAPAMTLLPPSPAMVGSSFEVRFLGFKPKEKKEKESKKLFLDP